MATSTDRQPASAADAFRQLRVSRQRQNGLRIFSRSQQGLQFIGSNCNDVAIKASS